MATIGDLFHRWRLDCCHSTRKPINVTTPLEMGKRHDLLLILALIRCGMVGDADQESMK